MTNQDILTLAAECDLITFGPQDLIFFAREIESRAAKAEREECAKLAWDRFGMAGRHIAGAIRARGRA